MEAIADYLHHVHWHIGRRHIVKLSSQSVITYTEDSADYAKVLRS